jgi:ankyrin repeat protein
VTRPRRVHAKYGLAALIVFPVLASVWVVALRYRTLELNSRLVRSVETGDAATVRRLLESGADPNAAGNFVPTSFWELCLAAIMDPTRARGGRLPALLMAEGLRLHLDGSGRDFAVTTLSSPRTAHELISHGADANARTDGFTALSLAVLTCPNLVQPLLDRGAKINSTDENGDTPLVYAVRKQDVSVVRLLLIDGANANCRNRFGMTPLIVAAGKMKKWPSVAVVKLLLQFGADTSAEDEDHENALAAAKYDGNPELIAVLRNATRQRPPLRGGVDAGQPWRSRRLPHGGRLAGVHRRCRSPGPVALRRRVVWDGLMPRRDRDGLAPLAFTSPKGDLWSSKARDFSPATAATVPRGRPPFAIARCARSALRAGTAVLSER